jgi:hypothetical protein
MPEDAVCPLCGDTGFTYNPEDDTSVQQCICSYKRSLRIHLGLKIASAPLPENNKSPLFVPPKKHGDSPKVDRTVDNLFLKGYYGDLLPHLKWALGCKGLKFRFVILSDERVLRIWLGSESHHSQKDVEGGEGYIESLHDVIGPDVDLFILRLGYLGYPNKSMPGVLHEALLLREAASKPTWIIEQPNSIFGYGHRSYSDDLAEYIQENFEVIKFKSGKATSEIEPQGIDVPVEPIEDVGLGVTPTESPPQPKPVQRAQSYMPKEVITTTRDWEKESDIDRAMSGSKSKKKPWNKRGGGGL